MAYTKRIKDIEYMYQNLGLDTESIWHKTKTLLNIYRKVSWSIKIKSENLVCETVASYGRNLDTALAYLSEFVDVEKKKEFEDRVTYLFESKWLIDLVDLSLTHIRSYPEEGEVYFTILENVFLKKTKIPDVRVMEIVNMEKTMYYQRKKEAIYLMGIALWGYAIPTLKKEIEELRYVRSAVSMAK